MAWRFLSRFGLLVTIGDSRHRLQLNHGLAAVEGKSIGPGSQGGLIFHCPQ